MLHSIKGSSPVLGNEPLVRLAIEGDREAIGQLFASHMIRLLRTTQRILRNRQDAEDALQDGLLSAFRKLSGFKGESQFSTWLTRIVINAALMRLRRTRPEGMVSIDQVLSPHDQPLATTLPASGPNPEEIYERREQLQLFERTLQTLPKGYRQAVWLRHVQGLQVRETAEALGLRAGTVKSRLSRARLRLIEKSSGAKLRQGSLQSGQAAVGW